VAEASVLVSSGAVYATLGNDVRPPRDIDLIVPYDAYAYLREQPGWDESSSGFLENGRIEVGIEGWGHIPLGALKQRSSQQDGVNVASLSDTINWKTWGRGNEKDQSDIAAIRDRLLDPARPPLPSRFTQDEIAIASSCLPEELRDHPDAQAAIELAANGLATVRALYGDGRIGRPNYIVGLLERPEYKAIATYHNGFDLPEDMHNLQRHLKNIGATPEQHFEALAAEPYTDIIYGNGRQRNNPESYDELRSANLLAAHALTKGYSPEAAMRRCKIVLGTTFDQKTGRQLGRHDPDPVVRAVAGIDLHGLSNPSAEQQADLAIEDGTSARWSLNRTLGRAAEELGVVIGSTDEGLAFTDEYPDFRPSETPQGPTVKEFLAGHIEGSGDFADPETGYQAPDGWTLEDKPARAAKAARLRDVSVRFRAGEITAQQAAQELRAFNPPRTKS
jgi:hypothetical protein